MIKKVEYLNYEFLLFVLVKMYLKGDFGKNVLDVDLYIVLIFFIVDRYVLFKIDWEEFYNEGGIIIVDRYIIFNMVY